MQFAKYDTETYLHYYRLKFDLNKADLINKIPTIELIVDCSAERRMKKTKHLNTLKSTLKIKSNQETNLASLIRSFNFEYVF